MSEEQPNLMEGALSGDAGAVDAALQKGATVNEMEDGRTALHNAAAEGHLDVVKVLIFYKANPNVRSRMEDDNGGTALHLAAEGGHTGVMEELIRAKGNVDVLDSKGRQASHRAASRGQGNALELLKKYGADMDARDAGKATPLHFASFYGDLETVRWLVQIAGVITTYKDKNGRQPKDVAKRFHNNAVHRFLKNSASGKKGSSSMFGGPKARRSMRESSRDRAHARDSSAHRRNESPAPSSEPETFHTTQRQQGMAEGDNANDQRPQPSSLPLGLGQAHVETHASTPSLSPPDSPQNTVPMRRHDSHRRTWSLGSAKGKSNKNQVEELLDIKARQEEELDIKDNEMSQLKVVLSKVQQEKTQAEDQMRQLRDHLDVQTHQLTEAAEAQQRTQDIVLQHRESEANLNEALRREAELQEQLALTRKDVDTLKERDALSHQTIEALSKKVETLSVDAKIYEERLAQKEQEALRATDANAAASSKLAGLREEVEHLTCMMDDTRENALILQEQMEKKMHDLREEDEKKSNTIAILSERLREADMRAHDSQEQMGEKIRNLREEDEKKSNTIAMLSERLREAEMKTQDSKESERRLRELQDQDTESRLTIASLNAKVQQLQQNITDHDTKTLTYHKQQNSKIEELTEQNETNQVTIAGLSRDNDQLNKRLKEHQDSIVWYQAQIQQKAREHDEKEEMSEHKIAALKDELASLTQKLDEAQKVSLTQYERGGTMVALQKRDAAQKQSIKALENRLQHLTQKLAESEKASLSVQRQQLEKINSLNQQLDEARSNTQGAAAEAGLEKQLQELREKDLSNHLIIEALNKKVDQLSEELKKNYSNFFSWQTQQQEKDKEHEQREAVSQRTIAELREEVERFSRSQQKVPIRQVPQPWRPSGPPPPVPYSQKYNHVSPPHTKTDYHAYSSHQQQQ